MKSLEDLKKLRDKAKENMTLRSDEGHKYQVIVGMGTCGIAAGARAVLTTLVEAVATENLSAIILQTGTMETSNLEPIVEVLNSDGLKTTYVLVDAKKAQEIALKHLKNDKIIDEYTIDYNKK